MIQGLKIIVSSEELKQIAEARYVYHTEKLKFYQDQISQFKKASEDLPEAMQNYTNGNSASALDHRLRDHENKAQWFKFFGEHVIPNEQYELMAHEISTLEITERTFNNGMNMAAVR